MDKVLQTPTFTREHSPATSIIDTSTCSKQRHMALTFSNWQRFLTLLTNDSSISVFDGQSLDIADIFAISKYVPYVAPSCGTLTHCQEQRSSHRSTRPCCKAQDRLEHTHSKQAPEGRASRLWRHYWVRWKRRYKDNQPRESAACPFTDAKLWCSDPA